MYNYVQILFSLMIFGVAVVGYLINVFEKYLPVFIRQAFRYGKFSYKGKSSWIKPIQVPKSWFKHFYVFASILMILLCTIVVRTYLFNQKPYLWVSNILDFCYSERHARTAPGSTLLATILMTIQCLRRFYDTHFVSVFGEESRIDLAHYLAGYIHYAGVFVAIILESPGFDGSLNFPYRINFGFHELIAAGIFLWACWHQYRVTEILANLRKDDNGNIVTSTYKLPCGDWFQYVSSPHLLAEIIMYMSITIILYANITWWFIFGWVLTNQIETALLSHWWYQATFKTFPKNRKAIIPYIF